MPYEVKAQSCTTSEGRKGSHVVVNKNTGKAVSCHLSQEKAKAAMRAKYANEKGLALDNPDSATVFAGGKFWKQLIPEGVFKHPVTKQTVQASRKRLERWRDNTMKYMADGAKVHFPDGHTNKARDNMGGWERFEVLDPAQIRELGAMPARDDYAELWGVVDVPRQEDADKISTTIKDVSIYAVPDLTISSPDGKITHYGEGFQHVCATPVPVVPSQSNFVPADGLKIAASADGEGGNGDEDALEGVVGFSITDEPITDDVPEWPEDSELLSEPDELRIEFDAAMDAVSKRDGNEDTVERRRKSLLRLLREYTRNLIEGTNRTTKTPDVPSDNHWTAQETDMDDTVSFTTEQLDQRVAEAVEAKIVAIETAMGLDKGSLSDDGLSKAAFDKTVQAAVDEDRTRIASALGMSVEALRADDLGPVSMDKTEHVLALAKRIDEQRGTIAEFEREKHLGRAQNFVDRTKTVIKTGRFDKATMDADVLQPLGLSIDGGVPKEITFDQAWLDRATIADAKLGMAEKVREGAAGMVEGTITSVQDATEDTERPDEAMSQEMSDKEAEKYWGSHWKAMQQAAADAAE